MLRGGKLKGRVAATSFTPLDPPISGESDPIQWGGGGLIQWGEWLVSLPIVYPPLFVQ